MAEGAEADGTVAGRVAQEAKTRVARIIRSCFMHEIPLRLCNLQHVTDFAESAGATDG
jgi:hypothetical protein